MKDDVSGRQWGRLDYAVPRAQPQRSATPWLVLALVLLMVVVVAQPTIPWSGSGKAKADGARLAAAEIDVAAMEAALDAFKIDVGRYPTSAEGLLALLVPPPGASAWKGPYVRPSMLTDPWGNPYRYATANGQIASAGVDGNFGTGDDIRGGNR